MTPTAQTQPTVVQARIESAGAAGAEALQTQTPVATDQRELVSVLNGGKVQDLTYPTSSNAATDGSFPENGAVEWFIPLNMNVRLGRLKILDLEGTDVGKVVRVRQAESGFVIAQIYIHPGEGGYLDIPYGNYLVSIAEGPRWYGRPRYFGPSGSYFNALRLLQVGPDELTEQILPGNSGGRQMMSTPGTLF